MLEAPNAPDFDIIILINNSGELFDVKKEALSKHIENGRGILGVHSALASFLDGQDAEGKMKLKATNSIIQNIFGTHFLNHPPVQEDEVFIDRDITKMFSYELCKNLPDKFLHTDEFFNYSSNPCNESDIKVIAYVNEKSYEGGLMGARHPVIWYRHLGRNKAPIFYCALGHFSHYYNPERPGRIPLFLHEGLKFVSNELSYKENT